MHRLVFPVVAYATTVTAGPLNQPAPTPNGPFGHTHRVHALVGGDVVTEPGQRIEDATILLRGGIIEAVGPDVVVPPDARIWPVEDRVIYAGFIDPAVTTEVEHATQPTAHWNARIHPELDPQAPLGDSERAALRKAGYCVAAVYPEDGILRGSGTITTLADGDRDLIDCGGTPAMASAFERGGWGQGGGPGSLMGSIALMRQTLSDARWYAAALAAAKQHGLEPPARRDDLAALQGVVRRQQPLLLDVRDAKEALRGGALAAEMGIDLMLLGSGDEYTDLPGIVALQCPIIVPVKYPERPKLESIDAAIRVPLQKLQAWEQAPTNLRRLHEAGARTCVTTQGLQSPSDVQQALDDAIRAGLAPEVALSQMTTEPAALLGITRVAGRIAPGLQAHLVVCDGELFDEDTNIEETWVSGRRTDHEDEPLASLSGDGVLIVADQQTDATIDTGKKKLTITLPGGEKAKVKKVDVTGHRVSAAIDGRLLGLTDWIRIAGVIRDDTLIGRAVLPDGLVHPMRMTLGEATDATEAETAQAEPSKNASEDDATPVDPLTGTWTGTLMLDPDFQPPIELVITRADDETPEGSLRFMEQEVPLSNGTWDESARQLAFVGEGPDGSEMKLVATIDGDAAEGIASSHMGEAEFSVEREQRGDAADNGKNKDDTPEVRWTGIPDQITYPLGARGRTHPVQPEDVRIEHATIWTADDAGTILDGCLIVRDGSIDWVGPMDAAPEPTSPGPRIVDGTGWHITPGLIDCHSHTGIDGGVNEFNKACTAEVGIGDVVAGDSMNWYRQLAGGLTAANQLHGSANPIGGRNSVVKIRWGRPARDYPLDGAPAGIKFALGENVKRSSSRYPDTRMGVEAFIRDRLQAARDYAARLKRWDEQPQKQAERELPPRRDYEMETLAQILAGTRLIHCHSYRQDEILAFLRTCEDFGITIGTLQHILEGYKVADDIARHGAGASSFSDWWAYKIEVMDAIPWNGAIMHDQGVVVSFNSDDSELATRMNDEAAKAVRFGGLTPEEAIKFVTINPAIQLHIDDRTGSLKAGKDADFAVWNRDPLDSYSLCLQTWIDGARYFDRSEDAELAKRDAAERTRLIELALHESLGEPPSPTSDDDEAAAQTPAALATNPYADPADDHRGCCGIPADHTHTEHLR
ncbi:MAG: amidohydrolase family protein [Phycisphaerales bacterium]|nr:amidohydrolase family protein [Phycisphaerales bacterium]